MCAACSAGGPRLPGWSPVEACRLLRTASLVAGAAAIVLAALAVGSSLGVSRQALLGASFFGAYWNVSEIVSEDVGWLTTTVLIKLEMVVAVGGIITTAL